MLLEFIGVGTVGVLSVFFTYLLGRRIIKKDIPKAMFDGYTAIINDLTDEETAKDLEVLASKVIKSGMKGGMKGAMPNVDIKSIIGLVLLRALGGMEQLNPGMEQAQPAQSPQNVY